jgi:hypothetical protein
MIMSRSEFVSRIPSLTFGISWLNFATPWSPGSPEYRRVSSLILRKISSTAYSLNKTSAVGFSTYGAALIFSMVLLDTSADMIEASRTMERDRTLRCASSDFAGGPLV